MDLAEEPGNASKACRIMGLSRATFYRYQNAVEHGGIDALVDQNRRKARNEAIESVKNFLKTTFNLQ